MLRRFALRPMSLQNEFKFYVVLLLVKLFVSYKNILITYKAYDIYFYLPIY